MILQQQKQDLETTTSLDETVFDTIQQRILLRQFLDGSLEDTKWRDPSKISIDAYSGGRKLVSSLVERKDVSFILTMFPNNF